MVELIAWMIAGILSLPMLMLAAECLAGSFSPRPRTVASEPPPFIVLMPAHDEAAGIAIAIRAVRAQLRTRDQLIVIADNCSDDTAAIAEREGATVLCRADPDRRGKGYALEFARQHIADGAGQVVIVVDADCRPQPQALAVLASQSSRHHAVVQGCYLLDAPPDASARVRVSCFAFLIKNLVRQVGLCRLGGAAILQGSGMAFPMSIFRRARWSSDSLVEDLELGLRLLIGGESVIFAPSARFVSDASSDRGTIGQRRRWEHGILATALRFAPRLFLSGRPALMLVALDLLVPPTVLLLVIAALGTLTVLLLGAVWPIVVILIAWTILFAGIATAWTAYGRALLPAGSMVDVARYALWKLPILFQFLTRRERHWVRTEREP